MRWVLGAAGAVTVVLAAAAAVWRAVSWVHRRMRQIVRLVDDLAGEPGRPGVARRPGLMERVARIETLQREHGERLERGDRRFDAIDDQLAAIDAELRPNHGSSLRDQVDAVARVTGAGTAATESRPHT